MPNRDNQDPLDKANIHLRNLVMASSLWIKTIDTLSCINRADRLQMQHIIYDRFKWNGRYIKMTKLKGDSPERCNMGGCEDAALVSVEEETGTVWYWCGSCGDGGG